MNDVPIWLQLAFALLAVVVFGKQKTRVAEPETSTGSSSWQRFEAVRAVLASQSRRFGDVDATLGVMVLFELTCTFWFLDKGISLSDLGIIVIAWLMLVPVTIAVVSMRFFGGRQSPEVQEFLVALEQDEEAALKEGTADMAASFEHNRVTLQAKETGVNLSLVIFTSEAALLAIGRMLHWW